MDEVQGDAAFSSFPDESFRFGINHADGADELWLENTVSKKRWTCEVTDVAAFAPADVVLPKKTVLHYVTASLKESATSSNTSQGPILTRDDGDETLQLEVLIKLGVADFAWAPKYVFPLTLVSPPTPAETQAEQITLLTAQVQELQQEVKTLKLQMQSVIQAQAAAQPNVAPLPPSPVPQSVVVVENRDPPALSRGDQVWGDIISHTHHKLVQTEEYRESKNPLGAKIRSHRQHTCKVCSVLRGNGRRPSQSSLYCPDCTERHNGGMIFLCDKARPHDPNQYYNATCNQIWHSMWNNGENIPQTGTSSIRMRKKLKPSPKESETNASTAVVRPKREARR
ncbi:hypothetical protein PHMEG_0003447 [Phytophthora megakarya]|uniref:Uncharacterized protein n=1 Tax=Phytophthora megakarya TaxID=4795 RepID=A0A225WW32_9STRA|nr:hypothetical protein PHMEG_0003447 [Phytophthora megakarya]